MFSLTRSGESQPSKRTITQRPSYRKSEPDFDRLADKSLELIGYLEEAIADETPECRRLIMQSIRESEYLD